jgi:uncharacterized protein YgiM (DUF1202 family)
MLSRVATFVCLAASLCAAPQSPAPTTNKPTALPAKKTETFKPFTGKLTANKVRIRTKADTESPIIRQMSKNDLLLIVGEEGDFYSVEPLKDTKAYIFRSYCLDNVIEASRVNVRLEPHVDAPIIGQLQAGDKIQGTVCSLNHKWLEIAPPKGTKFYVAKEFVSQAGGPDMLANMEKRKLQVEELLTSAYLNADVECKKDYEEMAPQHVFEQFQTIMRNFSDFPQAVTQAKEGLALLKETYLNKKITYLESRAELSSQDKQELIANHKKENLAILGETVKVQPSLFDKKVKEMSGLGFWDTLEESLYLSWSAFHSGKSLDDYYAEQKANASVLTGTIERYTYDVKNKPGEYLLRGTDEAPLAYLYSTQVPLEKFEGKTVTILAAPRPNNHFAFPAYYVFSAE